MSRAPKAALQEIGQPVVHDPCDLLLTLKPAELEELLVRLCSCSTRRLRSREPRHAGRRCRRGGPAQWCRLGARATGPAGYADTRFG
ncbi:MAG: hypothetical protein JO203_01155 [Gammaproteobacteria bacterium]|nr:hypothetical protein [Gammaproteobacteria bacterium]